MKCDNCIHKEACNALADNLGFDIGEQHYYAESCKHFTPNTLMLYKLPKDYSKLTPIFELHNGEDTLLEFVKKCASKELEKERNEGTNNE